MLKAIASDATGRQIVLLGLSFGNLAELRAKPGDTFIRIQGEEIGVSVDILIFSGETEGHLAQSIGHLIGPETKTRVSDKLKN